MIRAVSEHSWSKSDSIFLGRDSEGHTRSGRRVERSIAMALSGCYRGRPYDQRHRTKSLGWSEGKVLNWLYSKQLENAAQASMGPRSDYFTSSVESSPASAVGSESSSVACESPESASSLSVCDCASSTVSMTASSVSSTPSPSFASAAS